jgi:hypothetical protein
MAVDILLRGFVVVVIVATFHAAIIVVFIIVIFIFKRGGTNRDTIRAITIGMLM